VELKGSAQLRSGKLSTGSRDQPHDYQHGDGDAPGVVTADALADPRFSEQQSVVFNVLRSMMCAPFWRATG